MANVNVYRNFGDHQSLDFRTYRDSITESINSPIAHVSAGARTGLELLEEFGRQAPSGYTEMWDEKNPLLDSTYAFLCHPNEKELLPKEVNFQKINPDGSLTDAVKREVKDYWAEVSVDPKKCIVASHNLAGRIVSLRETELIPQYWGNAHVLENFLREYEPTGNDNSSREWKHKETGETYGTPEVLIPLSAIDKSRFLNN
jgi:hypothetical protein